MRRLGPKDERVVELGLMLNSEGWRKAAKPALEGALAKARGQLERAIPTDVATVAGLQDRIRWLKKLLEDPLKVLTPDGKDVEEQ